MSLRTETGRRRFGWFAWLVLALNFPVILWGAYVRVSYSGDGCGAHWPFCNGQVLPQQMTKPTVIEFTHRLMTSVDTFAVIALCVWAFLAFPKGHAVRRYSIASFLFLMVEAALGAGLVLFRMVARDQSAGRIWYLSGHLTNTMLLLAALTITAWLASTDTFRIRLRNASPALFGAAVVTLVVSLTGVVAALGDMLFPSSSLAEGMQLDWASGSPMLLRLRMMHPAMALLGTAFVLWVAMTLYRDEPLRSVRRASVRVMALMTFQVLWGALNLTLLAPLWMQLSHLLVADLVWIAVVLLIVEVAKVAKTAPALSRQPAFSEAAQG